MAEITMTFDVPDVDPTLTDPLDIAGDILDAYNDDLRVNGQPALEVGHTSLEAEWK